MKKWTRIGLACAAMLSSVGVCDAHVLVFRGRLSGTFTREDAFGKFNNTTWPTTQSSLVIFDLDTDCWIQSSVQETSSEEIMLDERPKTAKAPASKTFYHSTDNGEGQGEHRVVHKFEFYSKNSKFYYFYFQTEDLRQYGFDTGSILAQGDCRSNVNIGGGRISSVPKDFTAFCKRGDGQTFKSGVLSAKYDTAITTAVNDYLQKNSIQSVKGSGISTSIPAAVSWLISNYLPQNGYVQVNAP